MLALMPCEVKRFIADHDRYIVGDINGNVKCILRSKGMKERSRPVAPSPGPVHETRAVQEPELDFRTNRPEQLKTATTAP